jgi:hypothetical protein
MKTARFTDVVEKAGRPSTYTLWTPAKDDVQFQRALKANRVMTIHHETVGTAKDLGTVGHTEDAKSLLLVFPKSVKRFEGKRVVGIKYELLD